MSQEADSNTDKKWTEAERLELAAKLDADLDAFIDSLEKRRYEEGWPEDRWQEEMDKHPFFMKKAPQPGDEVHPMFEGLQKLKYDPEENTLDELALNYKEDGNFYMKHKKFRMAVCSFTEGINTKCENPDILAVLYNNRSAAQYFVKNYRSALNDAKRALVYKPDYTKAHVRAAQCAFTLNKFADCAELCESFLERMPENEEIKQLLFDNKMKQLEYERNQRKETAKAKKKLVDHQRLCNALKARNVKFDDIGKADEITEEFLHPKFLPLEDHSVEFDDDDKETLLWPAAFSYPEFLISDFLQQLSENTTIQDCLTMLFNEHMPCDKTIAYRSDDVNVYYENRIVGTVHSVKTQKTIKEIISEESFFVTGGALLFYVVPKNSHAEHKFLNQKRRPLIYMRSN